MEKLLKNMMFIWNIVMAITLTIILGILVSVNGENSPLWCMNYLILIGLACWRIDKAVSGLLNLMRKPEVYKKRDFY